MKTVLVTGGNRGIGLEICKQLDKLGYKVILGSRELEKGEKAISSFNSTIIVKQLDITNEQSIQALFTFIQDKFGKLDVLINNAGIGASSGFENAFSLNVKKIMDKNLNKNWKMVQIFISLIEKMGIIAPNQSVRNIPISKVKNVMETNFYGTWRMIQLFIPLLIKSGNGRIINISSGMSELKNLTGVYSDYCISKSSLNALTIMFATDLKRNNIHVNAVCPGWVKTDLGGPNAPLTVTQGADTTVWLATEKEISTGKFFRNRMEINW